MYFWLVVGLVPCELRLDGALEFGKTCVLYRDSYQQSLKDRMETISNLEYQIEYLTEKLGEANILVSVYESQLVTDGCITKGYKIDKQQTGWGEITPISPGNR